MFLGFLGKSSLVLSLLVTSLAYAKTGEDQIPCPSILSVQQTANKIDKVYYKVNLDYSVGSSTVVIKENDLSWFVGVNNITTKSPFEAILVAKKTVQEIRGGTTNSIQFNNLYFCFYNPGEVVAVGGLDVNGNNFNPAMFKS